MPDADHSPSPDAPMAEDDATSPGGMVHARLGADWIGRWATALRDRPRVQVLLVAVMGLYLALGFLGRPDFWGNHMESRRAEVGREMIADGGSWLVPQLNGRPFVTKPPLFYWMTAASMEVGWVSEGWARLPSALMGLVGALAVGWLAWRWRGRVLEGALAAGILLTSAWYLQYMRYAEIDVSFTAALALSIAMLAEGLRDEARQWRWFAAFWVFCGVGVMLKGYAPIFALGGAAGLAILPAKVTPGSVTNQAEAAALERAQTLDELPAHAVGSSRRWLLRLLANPGILLMLALVAPYYLTLYLKLGPQLTDILHQETLARFGENDIRQKPVWYYLSHPDVFLPWAFFLPQTLWWAWRQRSQVARYLLCFVVVTLFMLSVVPSKKQSYLLPLLPALSVLTAAYLGDLAARSAEWRRESVYARWTLGVLTTVGGIGVSLAVLGFLAAFLVAPAQAALQAKAGAVLVSGLSIPIAVASLAVVLVLAALAWRLLRAGELAHVALVGTLVAGTIGGTVFQQVLPTLNAAQGVKRFATALGDYDAVPPGVQVYTLLDDNYSLSFYAGRIVLDIESLEELPPTGDLYVVTRRERLPMLDPLGPRQELFGQAEVLNLGDYRPKAKYDLVLVRIPRPTP